MTIFFYLGRLSWAEFNITYSADWTGHLEWFTLEVPLSGLHVIYIFCVPIRMCSKNLIKNLSQKKKKKTQSLLCGGWQAFLRGFLLRKQNSSLQIQPHFIRGEKLGSFFLFFYGTVKGSYFSVSKHYWNALKTRATDDWIITLTSKHRLLPGAVCCPQRQCVLCGLGNAKSFWL